MFVPGMFFFGVVLPVAVVALIAYGVWELARSREQQPAAALDGGGVAASAGARSILDERFARGDIDAGEYVQRRALLDGTVPSPPTDAVSAAAAPMATTDVESTPLAAETPTTEVVAEAAPVDSGTA